MNVLMLSASDTEGGAARAAYRLHKGLQGIEVGSTMLVKSKQTDDPTVLKQNGLIAKIANKFGPSLDVLPLKLYTKRKSTPWGVSWLRNNILTEISSLNSDLIHLHWICGGFVPLSSLPAISRPLIWTLHDSWAFTGGCHIPFDCIRYKTKCGICPDLNSKSNYDLSRLTWKRKEKFFKNIDLTVVAPSNWLAGCARSSSLFSQTRVEVIANGLDTDLYKPLDQNATRELLNLPTDKQLILFGAMNGTSDPNKGFPYLVSALQRLAGDGWAKKAEIVIFGSSQPRNSLKLGFKTHYIGRLHDDISLVLLYSAADLMVVPSIQESFGQTASEAMACGTPVVAFATSGLLDIVDHKKTGFLAKCFDAEDFAAGIAWVLSDDNRRGILSRQAREKVEREFKIQHVARQYLSLYNDIVNSKK